MAKIRLALFFLLWLLILTPLRLYGITYVAGLDDTSWQLEPSPFYCRLSQSIPDYGEAIFYHRAGEKVIFRLRTNINAMKQGQALLISQAPAWRPRQGSANIGYVPIEETLQPINIGVDLTQRILKILSQGSVPLFVRRSWYDEDTSIRVGISSVRFEKAYDDYIQCVGGLLPVNYDQIVRSSVFFNSKEWQLSAATKGTLDDIITYVKTDDKVRAFIIDGHSDNLGGRRLNRELSDKRAEAVTQYLIQKGIDEEMITTRYHGERFPVANNNTKEGRDRNRRVTLRLERDESE